MKDLAVRSLPHMLRHYRSETHWYIPHEAGQLKISLRAVSPQARHFIPGITTYFYGKTTKTTVSATNEDEFQTALASATNKVLFYDPVGLTAKWILPDGTIIEGLSVDAEVEAGTTLCICSDFYACELTVDGSITKIEYRDLPPFQGGVHIRGRKRITSIADIYVRGPFWDQKRMFSPGGMNIRGSEASPSTTIGTTKDISRLMHRGWVARMFVEYAPYVTGDLADIDTAWCPDINFSVWGESATRTYIPKYKKNDDGNMEISRDFSPDTERISFHHCGVHGVPKLSDMNQFIDWTYYACPNAKPEDFDGLIESLMTKWFHKDCTVDGVGFVWSNGGAPGKLTPSDSLLVCGYSYEAGKPLIPAYGTLVISNRTADPVKRAEQLALLRAAGWSVTEIDDSLEDGIYATRDV